MKKFNPSDDQWLRRNFEKLVRKHAGKFVAVANGKMAFGRTREEVEKKILKHSKNVLPSVLQIPHQESLICAL